MPRFLLPDASVNAVTQDPSETPPQSVLVRALNRVADVGNKLPDPLTFFVIMTVLVVLASVIFSDISAEVMQRSGKVETKVITSLISRDGIRWIFLNAIKNFINFAPLGPVLAVMLGIGIAERTGFITIGLRILVQSVPNNLITTTLVFAGVMSSMVADAGYIVLTPLGALLFAGLGRHPLAGLAAAFAGVSGGFSANLLITGLDPLLARLTDQAAKTLDPTYTVNAAANYYFMVASVFLITIIGTLVTSHIVEPMLGKWDPSHGTDDNFQVSGVTEKERSAFYISLGAMAFMGTIIAVLGFWDQSPLRDVVKPDEPAVNTLHSFFEAIEILVALLFVVPGIVYGALLGKIKNDKDIAKMASDTMSSMGAYIVLAFVAGQFVAYFNHTNLGAVSAVKGASVLRDLGLTGIPLIFAFILVASMMNLFVGSASAKWAFMAPIFVPMLMAMGLSPETVQASYRVGDSVTNIISPLMPYLPIIIVFAQRYDRKAGLGTLMSAMLPYSIAFAVGWIIMLTVWIVLGLPLGPGAPIYYTP